MTKGKVKANQNTNKRYNLKNDIIFKTFFSRKGNEEFLIDFLKALLKIEIREIKITEEVNLERLSKEEKGGRLDLQAILDNGTIVNIEMQVRDLKDIEQRTTFYSSKVISKETKRGTSYKDIQQVVMINILDYEMLGFDEYVSDTAIVLNKHREYEVLKGIKWYFIELPKFRKKNPNMNDTLNQWIAFIDDYDRGLIKMAEDKNNTLKKARIEMDCLTGDAEMQRLAELREKWEMEYSSLKAYAMDEGRKEGLEEGRKEGMKQGMKEGMKEGIRKTAKKLIKLGMSMEQIKEVTGLTEEEIHNLKDIL